MTSEYIELFNAVNEELREHCWPEVRSEIAHHAMRWRETRNPHHMDMAMILCTKAGCPISPTLQSEFEAASRLRMSGDPAGTAKNVKRERILSWSLILMANLHHAGLSVGDAARKVAPLTNQLYKPETLERYFGERMRDQYQNEFKPRWEEWIPNHRELWLPVAEALSDAPE